MSIEISVTQKRDIAAVTAAWIAGRPADPDAMASYPATPQEWLQDVVDRACHSYRDQYRTDALRTSAFIRRIPANKYQTILATAEQVPQLAAYLARLDESDWVWLGSPETQAGIAALVAMDLLTQAEADAILDYPMPELPSPP